MNKTKVKIFKIINYLLDIVIATAVCYLGSLILNTDLIVSVNFNKLIVGSLIALVMILFEGVLSYKIHQVDQN